MTTPHDKPTGRRARRLIGGGAVTLAVCAALGVGGMQIASASTFDATAKSSVTADKAYTGPTTSGTKDEQDWNAWADCMRTSGVADFPTLAQLKRLQPREVRALWTSLRAEAGYAQANQKCADLPGAPHTPKPGESGLG